MTARARSPRRRGGITLLVAAFVVVCGVVLVFVPPHGFGRGARAGDHRDELVTHALDSLELVHQSQRALNDADYGQVRQRLQRTEASLQKLVAELRDAHD